MQTVLQDHRVARLRLIFRAPSMFNIDEPLAYVEWFTTLSAEPAPGIDRYQVQPTIEDGKRCTSIIRLLDIRRTCRLLPDYTDPSTVCTDNMLDSCQVFFVDCSLDEHTFCILF